MRVLFFSDAGPLEGFTEATFRTAINDDGVGTLTAPPDVIASISGPISCEVDGQVVFRWRPEETEVTVDEKEVVTISGRGRSAVLERAVVLPVGYPNFTERTRTEQGAPLAVFADLLAEAQARGVATDLVPDWTPTLDSKGAPWTEVVDVRLDPGTNLRELLESLTEVEGAEWYFLPDGRILAAPQIGDDVSSQVVLFYGRDQITRGRRTSSRDQRQRVYIEASTGVSEAASTIDPDAGEIWLEAQDYADPLSRQTLADKMALKLGAPEEEADLVISPEAGAFTLFSPGDLVGLDSGSGQPEVVRIVGLAVSVTDNLDITVEATLISEVALFQQRLQRAIEAKADVQLAATPSIQRRHGLVTADKFLSGAVGSEVAISSENFVPAVPGPGEGWAIFGNGNAEFNDAIFRGDLQSDNYVPGVSGWFLDRDGNAEFEQGDFRGVVTTEGDIIIPPGAPAPGLGVIRARSVVDAGRTIYEIGLGAYPQTSFFEAGSVFADPTDTVVVGGQRQVGDTDLVGLGFAQQDGAAFLVGTKDKTSGIGPWEFVPDIVRGSTSGVTFILSPITTVGSPMTLSNVATTDTVLTVNGRSTFNENVTIVGATQTKGLTAEGTNVHSISDYRNITIGRDLFAARDVVAGRDVSGLTVFAVGAVTAGGQVSGTNGIFTGDLSVFEDTLLDGDVSISGDVEFGFTASNTFYRMNQAGVGSQGGEPTLDTSQDLFGFVGIPSRRIFRGYAGAWLTSSESRLKGEIVDADLDYCYDAVRSMRLTRYALHRDRDDYYTAKGEAFLGERDDFVDKGGPLRKFGIIVEEAPDEVADEEHANIDVYAYASLIAGAVKRLQERVEQLEGAGE